MGTEIILGRLWQCGDYEIEDLIETVKPGAVINLTMDYHPDRAKFRGCYVHWGFEDGPLPDIQTLEGMVQFVTGLVWDDIRVVVHCNAGLNRSGLVVGRVMQELQEFTGLTAENIIAHLRICRDPYALCNDTFANYIRSREADRVREG